MKCQQYLLPQLNGTLPMICAGSTDPMRKKCVELVRPYRVIERVRFTFRHFSCLHLSRLQPVEMILADPFHLVFLNRMLHKQQLLANSIPRLECFARLSLSSEAIQTFHHCFFDNADTSSRIFPERADHRLHKSAALKKNQTLQNGNGNKTLANSGSVGKLRRFGSLAT